jgi:hypothetical protein
MSIQYFYFDQAEAEILKKKHGGHFAVVIPNGCPPLVKDQRVQFTSITEAPKADAQPVAVVDNTRYQIAIEFVETDKLRRMETFGYGVERKFAPTPQAAVIDMESRRPAASQAHADTGASARKARLG